MNPLSTLYRGYAPSRNESAGFALVEVMIAFAILALGLSVISSGLALAVRSDNSARVSRSTQRLARSCLEAAGISTLLVPGVREGRIDDGYVWRETVTAARLQGPQSDLGRGAAPPRSRTTPYWVEVQVIAPDGTVARLGALKLAREGGT